MKTNIHQIKNTVRANLDFLRKKYGVENIGIFGSVARDRQTEASDIDILVDFSEPVGFFTFVELEGILTNVKKKVDLVTKKALKPAIKADVLREVTYV